jgi:hypothetical protein
MKILTGRECKKKVFHSTCKAVNVGKISDVLGKHNDLTVPL